MKKKILSIVMAAVTAASLGVMALAKTISTPDYYCSTYLSARRQYSREFAVKTKYYDGADIITAGIQCLRYYTGTAVGEGELVSNNNSVSAIAYESVLYSDCADPVRAFGSHSAYKNGQVVLFEFTQSDDHL